jgi:hypothetical protein
MLFRERTMSLPRAVAAFASLVGIGAASLLVIVLMSLAGVWPGMSGPRIWEPTQAVIAGLVAAGAVGCDALMTIRAWRRTNSPTFGASSSVVLGLIAFASSVLLLQSMSILR